MWSNSLSVKNSSCGEEHCLNRVQHVLTKSQLYELVNDLQAFARRQRG